MVLREDVEEAIFALLKVSNPTALELVKTLAQKFPVDEIRIALVVMQRYELIGVKEQFKLFLTPAGLERTII